MLIYMKSISSRPEAPQWPQFVAEVSAGGLPLCVNIRKGIVPLPPPPSSLSPGYVHRLFCPGNIRVDCFLAQRCSHCHMKNLALHWRSMFLYLHPDIPAINKNSYFNNTTLSDATIRCEGRYFSVHSLILFCHSEYFRKQLDGPWKVWEVPFSTQRTRSNK